VNVSINGEDRELKDGLTITELLGELGLSHQRVAVEVNAEVIRRAAHPEHRLADGDQVEIVTFVGGG
jgi:sulfur carrier protein